MEEGRTTYYLAAVYLRLSREEEGQLESNSIRSQKEMILRFISRQKEIELFDLYIDDGWTGTRFDRPGFQRMMADIEQGKVNCVIVKDLSRLGRDYIEAGRLIQKIFPAFLVRFIALTDGYDSLTADETETAMMIPVKNFVNDAYARDISAKVRSHQKIKREKGEFIGAFAVYGYRKNKEHNNDLLPDPYAACIVQRIFYWKMEGYSSLTIAKQLEEWGILSPLEYKKLHGEKLQTGFAIGVRTKWSAVAVKRILTNEMYTGTLVQGKEEKVNYKVRKTIRKPPEEWVRVPNTHPPIVKMEDFVQVQELLRVDSRVAKGEKKAHKYTGLLYCGHCRKPMMCRKKSNQSRLFFCTSKTPKENCSCKIWEEDLDVVIKNVLEREINKEQRQQIQEEQRTDNGSGLPDWLLEKEWEMLQEEWQSYVALYQGLYQDWKRNLLNEEEYLCFQKNYQKRCQSLQQTLERQKKSQEKFIVHSKPAAAWMVDRMTLLTLIKRIWIYEERKICVELRYQRKQ